MTDREYEIKLLCDEHDEDMRQEGYYQALEDFYKDIKKIAVKQFGVVNINEIEDVLDNLGYDYAQC